jgi:hypothetical protein
MSTKKLLSKSCPRMEAADSCACRRKHVLETRGSAMKDQTQSDPLPGTPTSYIISSRLVSERNGRYKIFWAVQNFLPDRTGLTHRLKVFSLLCQDSTGSERFLSLRKSRGNKDIGLVKTFAIISPRPRLYNHLQALSWAMRK